MQLTAEKVKAMLDRNSAYVHMSKPHNGLRVVKYKNKVFYDDLWNDDLIHLRGLVIDDDYNVVSFPFTKVFNHTEKLGKRLLPKSNDELVTIERKVNGFMAALSFYKGEPIVSTTGTVNSDFARMARESLEQCGIIEDMARHVNDCSDIQYTSTLIFEIVHPDDPHIIEEQAGVYLIGWRQRSVLDTFQMLKPYELDIAFDRLEKLTALKRFKSELTTWGEVKERLKTCQHEGFMVHYNGNVFKMKSPFYLTAKFLARLGRAKIEGDFLTTNKSKEIVDEDFHFIIDELIKVREQYYAMNEQERLQLIRKIINENLVHQ
jgi:hypothetical protein